MNYAILQVHPDYTECIVFISLDEALEYIKEQEDQESNDDFRMVLVEPLIGLPFGIGNQGEVYGAHVIKDTYKQLN